MKDNIILKNLKIHIFLLIVSSIIISYFTLQIAVYISYAIDGVLFHNSNVLPEYLSKILEVDTIQGLGVLGLIIILINLLIVLAKYLRERVTTDFTLKISSNFKKILYEHILNLNYESYNSYSKVEMLQRVNEDGTNYVNFFKNQFNLILDILSLTFFIVTKGIFLNVSVTVFLIFTIAIMLVFALWYHKKMNEILEKRISKKKKLLGATFNNINNFKFIRIYNRQKEEIQKYKRLNKNYVEEDIKFIKLILFYEIISEHITYLASPFIYLLGGIAIIKGSMTFGTLSALILFANKILNCLYSFGEKLEIIDNYLVVKQKVKKLLSLKEESNGNYYYDLDGDILFHNVNINISKKEILSNLNFTIKKGEKVAIIGENGTGKSSLAKAMLGFYKVDGRIYFNYHNIEGINNANIRDYVDFTLGDADLFSGSILENIKLYKEVEEKDIEAVVKDAGIYADIKGLEEGYETLVGEKGVKLSGGQKQRILIARCLYRNKPIMIFDNAFSKLDNKTKDEVLKNLVKKYPQNTMIFITHNSEIENYVDRIIKIEGGTNSNED